MGSQKEGETIRGCLRAAREHLRQSRNADGATVAQDAEGEERFFLTLGFALAAAEKLLSLALVRFRDLRLFKKLTKCLTLRSPLNQWSVNT